jgi:UDP-glucose 4-epimerase
LSLKAVGAEIRFESVNFNYDAKPVLHDFSLIVKPGQMVALVGLSGSGKTTIANLLLRFYDPLSGAVRVGGVNIRDVTTRDLRSQIAVVTQETLLFDETIRRNIEMGRPGATEAEIIAAARHAHAHDFIMEKPQGYDTMIGEKGVMISGGQKQRLTIARAILRNAPILVLDEAMSALDNRTERIVQAELEQLMQGRTTICIAHRLSTIQNADMIVVLDQGRIVETGKHEELLARNGYYRRLHDIDFQTPANEPPPASSRPRTRPSSLTQEPIKGIKALVTGGAGFIGSHIAEALCRHGAKVIVLDNLSLGKPANLDWKRNGDDLEFVEGDMADESLVKKLISGCDWVFHEGAMPSVPLSVGEPLKTHLQNLDATLRLLILARDAGVRRFMFASSSSIYGDADAPSKHEGLPPAPLSPYALQKYGAEKYGQLFHQLYQLPTVSLRYFNVFGPRQAFNSPYSGVIAKFCTGMLAGKAPVIYGDGLQARDFTYIENVVNANLLAAEAPNVAGKVFNVAGGQSISLLQLVAELNKLTGQSLKPQFEPPRVGDVRSSLADISAAEQELGFECRVSWEEGLRRTLEFYRTAGQ